MKNLYYAQDLIIKLDELEQLRRLINKYNILHENNGYSYAEERKFKDVLEKKEEEIKEKLKEYIK